MILYKKDIIKHSAAIQISGKINLLNRRIWNVLLANAFDDMKEKEEFKISINDLSQILKYDSNDIQYLKNVLYDLVDTTVEWNLLGKDKQQEWGVFSLLAEARIINGYCYYSYGAGLRKRLYNPSMYARISLSLQNKFKNKYALTLFELFLDYFQVKKGYGETPWITLKKFRELIGLEEHEYKQYKTLNYFVIKQPIKEINAISDLYIDLDGIQTKKERRRVVALKFIIRKNKENIIDIEALEMEECSNQSCLPVPEFQIDNQELFGILTVEFQLSQKIAIKILKNIDEHRIYDVVKEAKNKVKLSDNLLDGSDLILKNLFPQAKSQKSAPPTIDEIEKKLKSIPYHAFKKVRTLHADEVLLNAFKDLDFEIERRKQTDGKINNLGGWFRSRLPEPGEPYQFSSAYQEHLQKESQKKQRLAKEAQKEKEQKAYVQEQEKEKQIINEKITAEIEKLKATPEQWEAVETEATAKAKTKIPAPNQTKELNQLAEQKLKKLSLTKAKTIEKEAILLAEKALKGFNLDQKNPGFLTVLENQKIELMKNKYAKELNASLSQTTAFTAYQKRLTTQITIEIRKLIKQKLSN